MARAVTSASPATACRRHRRRHRARTPGLAVVGRPPAGDLRRARASAQLWAMPAPTCTNVAHHRHQQRPVLGRGRVEAVAQAPARLPRPSSRRCRTWSRRRRDRRRRRGGRPAPAASPGRGRAVVGVGAVADLPAVAAAPAGHRAVGQPRAGELVAGDDLGGRAGQRHRRPACSSRPIVVLASCPRSPRPQQSTAPARGQRAGVVGAGGQRGQLARRSRHRASGRRHCRAAPSPSWPSPARPQQKTSPAVGQRAGVAQRRRPAASRARPASAMVACRRRRAGRPSWPKAPPPQQRATALHQRAAVVGAGVQIGRPVDAGDLGGRRPAGPATRSPACPTSLSPKQKTSLPGDGAGVGVAGDDAARPPASPGMAAGQGLRGQQPGRQRAVADGRPSRRARPRRPATQVWVSPAVDLLDLVGPGHHRGGASRGWWWCRRRAGRWLLRPQQRERCRRCAGRRCGGRRRPARPRRRWCAA